MTYYNEIAKGYDELHKKEQLKKLKIIKENLKINNSDKLLDVGCGTGFSLDYFDCECIGIDPNKMAKDNRIIIGKAENLPFKDNEFDIVISVTAIHNFDDIVQGLKEIKRVGKNKFAFSILKKAKSYEKIKKLIYEMFNIKKEIKEDKDIVFISC